MSYELIQGDCLDVMRTIPAGSVDAIIADLPYGTTACAWDTVIPFGPLWEAFRHVMKPKAAAVLFGSQPFTSALVMSNPGWFKYSWVWEKTNSGDFMLAKYRPRQNFEDIAVFSDGTATYNPQMVPGKPYIDKPRKRTNNIAKSTMPKLGIVNNGTRFPSAIQRFPNGNNDILHPTQKPVALLEYLVRTYTNPGDTVLDCTMGSGTTGVACMHTGRRFVGIEMKEEYFAIAQARIAKAATMAAGEFVPLSDRGATFDDLPMFADLR